MKVLRNKLANISIQNDPNELPILLFTSFLYQKFLHSIQILAIYLILIKISPLRTWFELSNLKIVIYHIFYLVISFVKEFYFENSLNPKIHTSIITLLMLLDSFKII